MTTPHPAELTEAERVRLRELADAATPGPWFVEFSGELDGKLAQIECARWRGCLNTIDLGEDHATAEFIAAARTAVPALLDALEAAEQRAATAWAVHREHVDTSCQIIARHAGDATFAQIEARRLLEGIEALADKWERLARNGPATYTEIRRAHSAELRALLSTSSGRGEGDG